MPVSTTIRDVPDEVHGEIAARAARSGRSLQEYLRAQLTALAQRPTPEELLERGTARVRAGGTEVLEGFWVEAVQHERP